MSSSAAARPTSGCAPAPRPSGHLGAHLDDALGLRHGERLCVGIGDDELDALQPGRDHVVDGIAAGSADPKHDNARLHLANIGGVGHFCLTVLRQSGMRGRIATCKPCGLLPLWSRLDVLAGVQLVHCRRSSWPLSAEPLSHLQAVPSPHWPPWSRQSPAAAQPPGDRRARARARNLLGDRLPLLRAARSPPLMPRSLPPIGGCCLPGDHVVVGAYAVFQRDQRSPGLCHHPKVSAATAVAWQANERPRARFSGGHLERQTSAAQQTSAVLLERTGR